MHSYDKYTLKGIKRAATFGNVTPRKKGRVFFVFVDNDGVRDAPFCFFAVQVLRYNGHTKTRRLMSLWSQIDLEN